MKIEYQYANIEKDDNTNQQDPIVHTLNLPLTHFKLAKDLNWDPLYAPCLAKREKWTPLYTQLVTECLKQGSHK